MYKTDITSMQSNKNHADYGTLLKPFGQRGNESCVCSPGNSTVKQNCEPNATEALVTCFANIYLLVTCGDITMFCISPT